MQPYVDKSILKYRREEARDKMINRKIYEIQLTCQHEFGEVNAYEHVSEVKHFVVCRRCALRIEV